ncbi:MAG: hypothetical protein PSX80_11120 [bacterium]|nr:hypothetical protein [bacterium]
MFGISTALGSQNSASELSPGWNAGADAEAKGVTTIVHILPDGRSIEIDESAVPSIW